MARKKRILITTVCVDTKVYDYFLINTKRSVFRYSIPRFCSFGLRFIKKNLPEIDILEYPTWREFAAKAPEYDVVGFSFYQNEIPKIMKMARYARRNGVKELWAGNYGALTPEIQSHFDRVFVGYSEEALADAMGGKIETVEHPFIGMTVSLPFGININPVGILFTARGCNRRCTFCQTPQFCPTVEKIDLDSIDRALKRYKEQGVREIIIFDENFGMLRHHTKQVTELLQKHGLYWFCMTRADILRPNLDEWESKGLLGAFIGIESFSQESLDYIDKKETVLTVESLMKELDRRDLFTVGYYVIGFENETIESIEKDIRRLAELKLDMNQICVITPLPLTPLWKDLESKFGIIDRDQSHYDTKHLVWNHPNISPPEMERLLEWSFRTVYPRTRVFRTAAKFMRKYRRDKGVVGGAVYLLRKLMYANSLAWRRKRGP